MLYIELLCACSTEDDARLAIQLQKNELLLRRKQRTEREAEDLVYNDILLDHVAYLLELDERLPTAVRR